MEQHRYSSCSIEIHINTCSLASPYAYFTRSSDMLTTATWAARSTLSAYVCVR